MAHRSTGIFSALSVATALAGMFCFSSPGFGAAFTAGDVVVTRVGDGVLGLSNLEAALFLDEYDTTGHLVQTIALPTAASGSNSGITITGNSTSEGLLKLTPNGSAVTLAGYSTAVGGAAPSTSTNATSKDNRVVAIVDGSGSVDTSTIMTVSSTSSNGNARAAIVDGTKVYLSTSGDGVESIGLDAMTARSITTNPQTRLAASSGDTNTKAVSIFNGQLYASSAASSIFGVVTIGSGEPTVPPQTTTELNGMPTGTNAPDDFLFIDSTDLYVADDRTNGNGGIEKWVLSGGTWSQSYNLRDTANTAIGMRGLTGVSTASGVQLYATGTDGNLYSVFDDGTSPAISLLASASANEAFRGVAFVPAAAPEPASLGLLAIGGLLLVRRRR